MNRHRIEIPENLKNNIMLRVMIEKKEFSLIEDILGFKIGEVIVLGGEKRIVTDVEIKNNMLELTIIDDEEIKCTIK